MKKRKQNQSIRNYNFLHIVMLCLLTLRERNSRRNAEKCCYLLSLVLIPLAAGWFVGYLYKFQRRSLLFSLGMP